MAGELHYRALPRAGDGSVHSALQEFSFSLRYNQGFTANAPGLTPDLGLELIERFCNGPGIRPFVNIIECRPFLPFISFPPVYSRASWHHSLPALPLTEPWAQPVPACAARKVLNGHLGLCVHCKVFIPCLCS